jgi:hypothetical protein
MKPLFALKLPYSSIEFPGIDTYKTSWEANDKRNIMDDIQKGAHNTLMKQHRITASDYFLNSEFFDNKFRRCFHYLNQY